jgi:peptidase inhibitor family I36
MMNGKLRLAIGAVSLSFATLLVAIPNAQADNDACPSGAFCVFEHDNFLGGRFVTYNTIKHLGDYNFSDGVPVGDNASSMINNRDYRVALFQDGDCSGEVYNAKANSVDGDFSNNGFDNEASCIAFL